MFGLSKPNPKDKGAKLDQARAQAQNQAPDSIPGMFKPGEFVLPPDTVHAMGGKQALQGVVNATHTPVTPEGTPAAGLGLKVPASQPEVFFANGGAPEDQLVKRGGVSPANTFPQASPSAGANIYAGAGLSRDQFGSSGQIAQVPPAIGQQPGRQVPAPSPVAPAQAAPVQPVQQAPAVAAAPAQPPSAAPSPSNIFPGNRLQGASGFSGAPAVAPPAAAMSDAAATAKLKAVADMNSRGESYGSNAPTMASFGMNPSKPSAAASPAPATAGGQPTGEFGYADNLRSIGDDIRSSWKAGNYGEAVGKTVAGTVSGITTPAIDAVVKGASGLGGFAKGLFGISDAQAAPASSPAAAPSVAGAAQTPAAAAPATTTTPAVKPGITNNVGSAPASVTTSTTAASASQPGIYNHGRGQYSDQAGGMGFPAGFTGKPNAQNMAAAANLSASNAAPAAGQAQEGGFGLSAPTVMHSGNDWAARQRLKNLETSASSITNTERWGGKNALNNPAVQNFIDASRADLAAQGRAPELQQRTNEVNAGLKRTAMAEAGADRRAQGQIGLGMGQLSLGAQRNQLDAQRINSDERLRAPQIRAAERLGQLQDAYINAKTPEEQASIANQIRAYSGKEDQPNRFTVVPGGQEWDTKANVMRNVPASVLNNQTGQFVQRVEKPSPSENNINALRKNPALKAQFDQQFGAGAAEKALAQ